MITPVGLGELFHWTKNFPSKKSSFANIINSLKTKQNLIEIDDEKNLYKRDFKGVFRWYSNLEDIVAVH